MEIDYAQSAVTRVLQDLRDYYGQRGDARIIGSARAGERGAKHREADERAWRRAYLAEERVGDRVHIEKLKHTSDVARAAHDAEFGLERVLARPVEEEIPAIEARMAVRVSLPEAILEGDELEPIIEHRHTWGAPKRTVPDECVWRIIDQQSEVPRGIEVGHSATLRVTSGMEKMYIQVQCHFPFGELVACSRRPVKGLPPKIENARLEGKFVDGSTLTAFCDCNPGCEVQIVWQRQSVSVAEGPTYTICGQDVGQVLLVLFTGNKSGQQCSLHVYTEKIKPYARPLEVYISGAAEIGAQLRAVYSAAICKPVVQWFKASFQKEVLVAEGCDTYTVNAAERGWHIRVVVEGLSAPGPAGQLVRVAFTTRDEVVDPHQRPEIQVILAPAVREGEEAIAVVKLLRGEMKAEKSVIQWVSCDANGAHEREIAHGKLSLTPTVCEVGRCLTVRVTPYSLDGLAGPMAEAKTKPVEQGDPKILAAEIIGNPVEGIELSTRRVYHGGIEGDTVVFWFRGENERQHVHTGSTFVPTSVEVGHIIHAEIVPYRQDGKRGEVFHVTCGPVLVARPVIKSFVMKGLPVEGHTLIVEADVYFVNDSPGVPIVSWYRDDIFMGVGGAYHLIDDDVWAKIRVVYTAVDASGVESDPAEAISPPIEFAALRATNRKLRNCFVGRTVTAEFDHNPKLSPVLRWSLSRDGKQWDPLSVDLSTDGNGVTTERNEYECDVNDLLFYVQCEVTLVEARRHRSQKAHRARRITETCILPEEIRRRVRSALQFGEVSSLVEHEGASYRLRCGRGHVRLEGASGRRHAKFPVDMYHTVNPVPEDRTALVFRGRRLKILLLRCKSQDERDYLVVGYRAFVALGKDARVATELVGSTVITAWANLTRDPHARGSQAAIEEHLLGRRFEVPDHTIIISPHVQVALDAGFERHGLHFIFCFNALLGVLAAPPPGRLEEAW